MKRSDELIAGYLDDLLNEQEVEELQVWLKADAAHMQQFILENARDQQLHTAMSAYRHPVAVQSHISPKGDTSEPTNRGRKILTAAAAIFFAATLLTFLLTGRTQSIPATLSQASGPVSWRSVVGEKVETLTIGAHLADGTLIVEGDGSLAEFVYADGSKFVLTGSSELTLGENEGKRLFLHHGALKADVSKQPQGRPLRILTPTAEAVVLGTSFGMSSVPDETFLRVDSGAVELRRLADNRALTVVVDEQARASADAVDEMSTEAVKAAPESWIADSDSLRGAEWLGDWKTQNLLVARPRDVWLSKNTSQETHFHAGVKNPLPGIVTLREDSVVRVRYRIGQRLNVGIFISTFSIAGEFLGNFQAYIEERYTPPDSDGWREAEMPISSFIPLLRQQRPFQQDSIAGTLFLTTFADDVGLEVAKLEVTVGGHE